MKEKINDLLKRLMVSDALVKNVSQEDGKIYYSLRPEDKKIYSSQRVKCFFGFHVFKRYYLLWGDSKRDTIYNFCPICGKIGKMLEKPRDLTSGMSRE